MRKITLLAALALASAMVLPSSPASAWYCTARGNTGASGWGRSNYNYNARVMALTQCSVRTPRYGRCFLQYCVP